jgi:hypothetical protein
MATDDEQEQIVIVDEDGNPVEFEDVHEAIRLLRTHLMPGSSLELHSRGCDGKRGPDCDCGVKVYTERECNPKVSA